MLDAVVVGSGPNGLAAAVTLARAGKSVLVLEANDTIGGGTRSSELTVPGFVHDVCSAIHPLAIGSPFFRSLDLEQYGLRWIQPAIPLAHPLADDDAALLLKSLEETAAHLKDSGYRRLMRPLVRNWENLSAEFLQPLIHVPRHPLQLTKFGLLSILSARRVAQLYLRSEPAKALFAGLAAHSFLSLESTASAAFGLVLGMLGHSVGWPIPAGGAQSIADALAECVREHGGTIETRTRVTSLRQLPPARSILLDITPRQLLSIADDQLSPVYRWRLRKFRYGPSAFKIDFALSGPIPWKDKSCSAAGTVHLGGTFGKIAEAERAVARGHHPEKPFVLLAQPTLFDPARAPEGKHIAWAYCHVPFGSRVDMTERVETQIERFAPGFRESILARHTMAPRELETHNSNLVGGDINGGSTNFSQLVSRPVVTLHPYRTSIRNVYLCSSSTPPGGGVHGMCGYNAASAVLREVLR